MRLPGPEKIIYDENSEVLIEQWDSCYNYFILYDAMHTPPKGGVRTKKCYITFDTIFGCYLPRGTIIDGSRKCRMGAFCTIAKNSGEM